MYTYPITLTPDDNGTFMATSPDLPEVATFGDSEEDALAHAADAVAEAIAARLKAFKDIPDNGGEGETRVALSLHMSVMLLLFQEMKKHRVTRAELARALGVGRTHVDRLFDPNRESKMSSYEAAYRALGVAPSISVETAEVAA